MSIKELETLEFDTKKEILNTIGNRKTDIIGILMFIGFWITSIIINDTVIFELSMIIFSLIFVVYFYLKSISLETDNRMLTETLSKNKDFKKIVEELEKNKNKKEV